MVLEPGVVIAEPHRVVKPSRELHRRTGPGGRHDNASERRLVGKCRGRGTAGAELADIVTVAGRCHRFENGQPCVVGGHLAGDGKTRRRLRQWKPGHGHFSADDSDARNRTRRSRRPEDNDVQSG